MTGSSQHRFPKSKSCLINLSAFSDKVTATIDKGSTLDILCLEVSKIFNTVSDSILIIKRVRCGLDKWTISGQKIGWIARLKEL